jgi:endonuclease/exonuclease/phosphatase family metal-dependent hydrolase
MNQMASEINQLKGEMASLKLDHIFRSSDLRIKNTHVERYGPHTDTNG